MKEAILRDEFNTPASDPNLRVMQIVENDDKRSSENVYMDCPSWSPDSKYFTFWRRASDDGSKKAGFWICYVDDWSIEPAFEYDLMARSPKEVNGQDFFYDACMAPDGKSIYRFDKLNDKLVVRRIDVNDKSVQEICTTPIPQRARCCVSMSRDSKHLILGVFLGDGKTEGAPWGAHVFDVTTGKYWTIEFGNGFRNMHCQYSKNPDAPYDILVNGSTGILSDGSWLTPPDGSWRYQDMPPAYAPGEGPITLHHALKDDGSDWRMVPIADGHQQATGGHNGFLGESDRIFCAMYDTRNDKWRAPIFETKAVSIDRNDPDYWRGQLAKGVEQPIDLSRKLSRADSCHLACDLSGKHFISDTDGYVEGKYSFLWIATRKEVPGEDPYLVAKYLLLTRSTYKGQPEHAHPALSPDGKYVVFQSDMSGRGQVNVAYDFEYPE